LSYGQFAWADSLPAAQPRPSVFFAKKKPAIKRPVITKRSNTPWSRRMKMIHQKPIQGNRNCTSSWGNTAATPSCGSRRPVFRTLLSSARSAYWRMGFSNL